MNLKGIAGTMWSGKTWRGVKFVEQATMYGLSVVIYDHKNNDRNSDRDFVSIFPSLTRKLHKIENLGDYDCVVFDEVHLYNVFGNEHDLLDSIKSAKSDCLALFLGIYYDFYNGYEPFPIWKELGKFGCEIEMLNSRNPCAGCGTMENVFYTANNCTTTERIGGHYINVCANCKDKYLTQYKTMLKGK